MNDDNSPTDNCPCCTFTPPYHNTTAISIYGKIIINEIILAVNYAFYIPHENTSFRYVLYIMCE